MRQKKKRLTTEAVLRMTALQYDTTPERLIARTRREEVRGPRQVAQYISKKNRTGTLLQIATETGVTNHATILHSFKVVEQDMAYDKEKRDDVCEIEQKLSLMGYKTVEQ